jgi:hypothetical protein
MFFCNGQNTKNLENERKKMTCPKCQAEQNGNFCANCGKKLCEQCSECGEMEPIGRKACETVVKKARTSRFQFELRILNEMQKWPRRFSVAVVCFLGLGFVVVFSSFFFTDKESAKVIADCYLQGFLVSLVGLLFLGFSFIRIEQISRGRAEREFSKEFPFEAGILEKMKGEKQ